MNGKHKNDNRNIQNIFLIKRNATSDKLQILRIKQTMNLDKQIKDKKKRKNKTTNKYERRDLVKLFEICQEKQQYRNERSYAKDADKKTIK